MNQDIRSYNTKLKTGEKKIASLLTKEIDKSLSKASSKVWHAHPVWFIDENPIVGYSKVKGGMRLMFWSGMGFKEKSLKPGSGKFKDASITYVDVKEIERAALKRWLGKAKRIQWDYKNIVKRKGKLLRLK